MKRLPVNSSNINSIGYDDELKVLEIEFEDCSIYQYFSVPSYEYNNLISADSHGSYLSKNIKDSYEFERIR